MVEKPYWRCTARVSVARSPVTWLQLAVTGEKLPVAGTVMSTGTSKPWAEAVPEKESIPETVTRRAVPPRERPPDTSRLARPPPATLLRAEPDIFRTPPVTSPSPTCSVNVMPADPVANTPCLAIDPVKIAVPFQVPSGNATPFCAQTGDKGAEVRLTAARRVAAGRHIRDMRPSR